MTDNVSSGYVQVRVEPVTAENLRKFAAILNDMADKLPAPTPESEIARLGGVA